MAKAKAPKPSRAELIARRPDLSVELARREAFLARRRETHAGLLAYHEHLRSGGTALEMLPDGKIDEMAKSPTAGSAA